MHVNRPELIAAHGYDPKYAMHILRLAEQGREFLTDGRITLPMPEPERTRIFDVRQGKYSYAEVREQIQDATERLKHAAVHSPLPSEPDYVALDELMKTLYFEHWGANNG